jgi:hypothetical protein
MANVAVQADEFAEMNDWKLGDLRGQSVATRHHRAIGKTDD